MGGDDGTGLRIVIRAKSLRSAGHICILLHLDEAA